VKDTERSALFARARREAAPTADDRRQVRAALARKLGGAVGASVGITASKAAATVAATGPGVAAAVPASLSVAKGVAMVVAMAALGFGALRASSKVASSLAHESAPRAPSALAVPSQANPTTSFGVASTWMPQAPVPPLVAPGVAPSGLARTPPSPPSRVSLVPLAASGPIARDPHRLEAVTTAPTPVVAGAPALPGAAAPTNAGEPAESMRLAPPADPGDLALVADMQRALRQGDPRRALAAVHEHEARFPASDLAPERDGVRAIALCAAASPRDAARVGQAFVDAHPRSTLVGRVRAACGARPLADDLDTDREGSGQ
jgi:hypothetical protein